MSDKWITTKKDLLQHIERDWTALNTFLDALSKTQWTDIKNADDWAIKDHIAHLSAWENSVIAFLSGTPRHEGLGISETLYLSDGIDAMNLAIFKKHQNDPLEQVQSQFQKIHNELMTLINALSDEDLAQAYSYYLPEEGQGQGPPAINIVYGNTAHHYREHHGWMQTMLKPQASSST